MRDIKCPKCHRKIKLIECVCGDRGRKRIMVSFPCYHFFGVVYNAPVSTDNNTILKDFESISEEYFNRKPYLYDYNYRYLD